MYLLHQNMRNFSGGASPALQDYQQANGFPIHTRNIAYSNAFQDIRNQLLNQFNSFVGIAGFTEILSYHQVVPVFNNNLAQSLGLNHLATIRCIGGMNARNIRPEYITICVRQGLTVHEIGRILYSYNPNNNKFIEQLDISPDLDQQGFIPWCGIVGNNISYRIKGFVYLIGRLGNQLLAVAFAHNRYSQDYYQAVAKIMDDIPDVGNLLQNRMQQFNHQGLVSGVYIGGDFNSFRIQGQVGNFIKYHNGPTTWGGSIFDYWYSDVPNLQLPIHYPGTMTGSSFELHTMSDHVATLLNI